MSARVTIQPEAEADIAEAFAWYEAQQHGLGHDFVSEVDRATVRLATKPNAFAIIHNDVRRMALRRFPYVMIFVARGDDVFILGVFHQRRHPKVLRSRLPV